MIKILYCIYVGICSFHPVLPFIKANDLIAIAPLPANLIHPLAIRTFANWLDDVYLNSQARVRNNPSRFTESEDYSPLPDPIYRPQHSASGSLQNGTVQRSVPSNVLTKSHTPIAMDGSRAYRGGTTTLLLRPTLAIVIKFLFVCPPPHDPRSIATPFEYLMVSRHKKMLPIFWEPSSTSHHHIIEPNSIWIFIFPTKTYTTISILLFLTPNATTHTPPTLPPNSIHQYPTMPSKKSKQPPRKPPPEQIVPMVPLAIYPPPGHHPSDSAILGSHRGDTSSKSTANVRTNSLVSRSNTTTPHQPRGQSAGPSKSSTYSIFTQPNSIASTSSLTTSSTCAQNRSDIRTRSGSIRGLLERLAPSPSSDDDDFPPLATEGDLALHHTRQDDTPYMNASAVRKAVRAQNAAAVAKAKTHANLAEARRQRQYYADQEARFAVLASESFDETMEEHKEDSQVS
jgi:hypothetical protein